MSAPEEIKETKAQRVERIKQERSPLLSASDIKNELKKSGSLSDETIERLKWYGFYLQKPSKEDEHRYFMLRIKLVDGIANIEQLKTAARLSKEFGQNTADFTTRGDIQLHYIAEHTLDAALKELAKVNISTAMACGDCPRNIVTCPVDTVSLNAIVNVSHTVREIDKFFTSTNEFENLPRKFKIGICGCGSQCVKHEIQDLSFVAFKKGEDILFDITAGGGLGSDKRFASRLGVACRQGEIIKVCSAVASLFKELGRRDDRTKARVRHLLVKLGTKGFLNALETKLGFALIPISKAPKSVEPHKRNHYGISFSTEVGKVNIGCSAIGGRSSSQRLQRVAEIMEKYNADSIKFTGNQNFVLRGVPTELAHEVADKLSEIGYPSSPSVFAAGLSACTGLTYCRLAISETKEFATQLNAELESAFKEIKSPLNIGISGCQNGCSHPFIADISLVGTMVKTSDGLFERGFEIGLGGRLAASKSVFASPTQLKLTPKETKEFVHYVLKAFNSRGKRSFGAFIRREGKELTDEFRNKKTVTG